MKKLVSMILLLLSSTVMADELTLYAYPPKNDLTWTTPKATLYKFLGGEIGKLFLSGDDIASVDEWGDESTISEVYKSSMGHTIAHIQCTNSNNELYDKWVSFSGQNFLNVDKDNILKEKMGLGVLFYDYIDGHIISGEENIKRLIYYKGGRRDGKRVSPRYLKYKIDSAACDEIITMVEFFKTFHYGPKTTLEDLQKRPDTEKLYFTVNLEPYESYKARMSDPKALVGGGCAPFGVGLLKAAGKFDSFFDQNWRLNINVSEKLIGSKENPIRVKDLLFGKDVKSWTHAGYNNRLMSVYDPNKIWNFIGEVNDCLKGKKTCSDEVKPWIKKQQGLVKNGPVESYSDTRLVEERTQVGDNDVYELVKKTKTVKMEGIVVE